MAHTTRMLFLIDGYNVTRADDATRRLLPDDQRLALMRRLAARGRGLLGSGRIVVVWDKGFNAGDESMPGVEAVFSHAETADDVIVRMAEAATGPVTLVTADRELKSRVRERKGRSTEALAVATVFDAAEQTKAKRRPTGRHPHGGLPAGHAGITKELEDLWLNGKEPHPCPDQE
ncbi:MAG: NYN domain-containing protein [Coriobacteriia bacterium]|nr:NYN domain-containing protein [Coriobacteriia bacterium]